MARAGEGKRRAALEAIVAGERSQKEVAHEFGVSKQAVSLWVKKFKAEGAVVGARRERTKPLSVGEKAKLRELIESKPPSVFNIESEDDRWHWMELADLLFLQTRKRFPRKECMQMLQSWGVPDPDVSIERKRTLRHSHTFNPVNSEDAGELAQLLATMRERQSATPVSGAHAPEAEPTSDKAVKRAKRTQKERRKQKLAQKAKRKQRRKKRR